MYKISTYNRIEVHISIFGFLELKNGRYNINKLYFVLSNTKFIRF